MNIKHNQKVHMTGESRHFIITTTDHFQKHVMLPIKVIDEYH